jgi:superoxide reductase
MAVKKIGEQYRCSICGNEVTVTKVGGGTLVCCEQDMKRIESAEPDSGRVNLPDSGG